MGDLSGAVSALADAVRKLLNRGNDEEVANLKDALERQTAATQALQDAYESLIESESAEDVAQDAALEQAKSDLSAAQAEADEAVAALEALLAEINDAVDNPPETGNGDHPDNTLPNELPGAGEGEPDVINPLK
jgi:outer membrane protein TolC